jgi:hypothetical protein
MASYPQIYLTFFLDSCFFSNESNKCEDPQIHQKALEGQNWPTLTRLYLQEYVIASFQIVPMVFFLLMFECRVTNVSKLYGAYDSIGINVVSFGEFLSLSNPKKKCSAKSYKGIFLGGNNIIKPYFK